MFVGKSLKMSLIGILIFITSTLPLPAQDTPNDNKIRQTYKLILSRTPREGKEGSPLTDCTNSILKDQG